MKSVEAGSQLWQEEMGPLSWMWGIWPAHVGEVHAGGAHRIQPQTVSLKS